MFDFPSLPKSPYTIGCIEMHTGGEPLRVIVDGFPETQGRTVLERRRDCRERLDQFRKLLINEPRGHADMYAALLVPPNPVVGDEQPAHFGVIFMHNAGYSTMCGHATIALAKLAVQSGWVQVDADQRETEVRIDAPCGRVVAYVSHQDSELPVRFVGVPSFVLHRRQSISLAGRGQVEYDISYGGAFYAYVDVSQYDLTLDEHSYTELISFGRELKQAIIAEGPDITHPLEEDLSFLYGVIFMGAPHDPTNDSRNVCVFADGEVDRCPTGSGVCGRLPLHLANGELEIEQTIRIESIIGSVFAGRILGRKDYAGREAVVPEVCGDAFVTGESTFVLDAKDPLPEGLLLR